MSTSTNMVVKIDGAEIPTDDVFKVEIEQMEDLPDLCGIELSNIEGQRSKSTKEGAAVEVSASGATLFKGEVTGLEPTFDHHMPARLVVRAMSKMHRLSRGRKTRTFVDQTDAQIVQKVCSENGLSAQCDPGVKQDHFHQHNQSDLELILQLAKRRDFVVRVEDTTLSFKKRKSADSGVELKWGGGDGTLERFRPRQSAARQVNKVVVRGWDPVKKKEIVGMAQATAEFGGSPGPSVASAFGQSEIFETDQPVDNKEEADNIAKSMLRERQMSFVTGSALMLGDPRVKTGTTVKVDVQDPKFNGKYYVKSCVHRYVHSVAGSEGTAHREAGYRVEVRVQKDSEG